MRFTRRAAPVALIAAIAWPAFAFGGVYTWTYVVLMTLCAVFAAFALAMGGWRVDRMLAGCAAVVVVTVGLQLVPLSPNVLRIVSPASADFLARLDLGYVLASLSGPVWHPVSIDVEATWLFLAFFGALCALFTGVVSFRTTTSLRVVPVTVTVVGTTMALIGIIQTGAGSNLMYGIWAPMTATAVFSPFVNRNHFATWMLMALPVAMAQCAAHLSAVFRDAGPGATFAELLSAPRAGAAMVTAFSCFLMSVALLSTGSRSAFGGFLVIVIAGIWLNTRRGQSIRASAPAAALVVGLAVIAVGWIGWRPIVARVGEMPGTRLSGRLDAWSEAGRILRDFWPTGAGLNSYGTAMLGYHNPQGRLFFRTPHNDYFQVLTDGGVLAGLPIFLLIGLVAIRIARRTASLDVRSIDRSTRYGVVIGLAAVAAQEFVDFGLQTPANAVLLTVLAAYATLPDSDGHRSGAHRRVSEDADGR